MTPTRRSWTYLAFLVAACGLFLLPALADGPPAAPDTAADRELAADASSDADARQAADTRQREDYRRSVPPGHVPVELEGDLVKLRTLRNWALLTYPTGTLPPMPWTRAREHVRDHVRDAPVWRGEGIDLGPGFPWKAAVTPNTNTWTAVGPLPLDSTGTTNNAYQYGTVSGRVGVGGLAVDPSNNNVAYAGFSSGGFWKTTNLLAGTPTWTPLWDDKDFVTQAAGAIEIDPNDSDTLYVGTGDWAADDQFSAGIMKSTDAGASWTQLGADVFTPYSPSLPSGGNRWSNQNLSVIEVDPNDSSTVLAGTRYDLYLSNDGGSSWQICGFGNGYTNPAASNPTVNAINRISGIYLDGRGGSTDAYVAVGYVAENGNGNNGVYRFTVPSSGCPSWPSDFTTLFGGFPSGTGNGVNQQSGGSRTGRVELAGAIGPDSGLTLYAQVADSLNRDNEGTWVLRPDGGGTTWTKLSGWNSYGGCSGGNTGQDWYDLFIAVDPNDDKQLYIGHIDVFTATVNSGYSSMSQSNLTDVYGSSCPAYGDVHPDQHAFAWIGNSGDFLVGNDGGVYKNTTGTTSGWSQLNDSFNTNLFYAGQIGADFAGAGQNGDQWLFGGMQDNGSATWKSSQSDFEWTARSLGGDGFYTSFDPITGSETAGRWMTEYVYGDLAASTSGANGPFSTSSCSPNFTGSADWSTPFMIDTLHCTNSNCNNYLIGEDYVWASASWSGSCPSWSRISGSLVKSSSGAIITVGMAPSEPKAAAIGTSDGNVWWTQTAYSGGNCTQAAANSSSFSCSANTGASWINADASNALLPNRAMLQVAFDPDDHNVLYAAVGGFDTNTPSTPGHLFQLTRSGSSINVVDKTGNLPDVPAASVAVNPHDRQQVFVGTYFGFYYTDDIDAATPTWVRYQDGLPNTRIEHLTIDRGPSSDPIRGTTLAAFTYGRGAFVLKLQEPAFNNPPSVSISAPSNGASVDVGSAVTFTGTASDVEDGSLTAGLSWSSSLDGTIGSGGSFQTSSLSLGSHLITASVTDSGGKPGNDTITLNVNDPNSNGPQDALYNAGLGAPACAIAGSSCDSGSLLDGRANLGPEPNQPNTLNSCNDGTSGSYHSDESNDRIVVSTLDSADFTEGATVQIEATVYAWSTGTSDHLDLYYAADASSPSWVYLGTFDPPGGGVRTLSTTYTLPTGTLQAVRANFRYNGSASACSGGAYDDHDDLVFAVKPAGGNTAPTVTINAPSNGTTVTQGASVSFNGTATDTEDGTISANLSWTSSLDGAIGSGASFQTSSLSLGSHTITASVTDSGGLSDDDQITLTVNPPANTAPSVTITAPTHNSTVTAGDLVTFSGTATDNEDGTISSSLDWTSSLDGAIGSGASFQTSGLSVGVHTITASVTDSGGLSDDDQITLTVEDAGTGCGDCIDWSATTTVSYSNQDGDADFTVEDGGDTILLEDNTWRRTTETFNVTANTMLEVDFRSAVQGEIHGIGFDENDTLTDAVRIFQFHGTQNWTDSNHDFDNYAGGGVWTTYQIPVGQYYTGSSMYLVVVNDNDAGSGNDSRFRNVRVYESTPPGGTCAADVDFESGAAGWTNSGSSTCSTGSFVVDTPTAVTNSGVLTQLAGDHTTGDGNAFFSAVNTSAGVNDVDGGTCIVESPTYAVSEASDVSVWFFHGQRDAAAGTDDFFLLEISTNGGSSWTTMASYGNVTVNAAWTEATATVAAGANVRFRLQVADGPSGGDLVEAGLDDVTICPSN